MGHGIDTVSRSILG